MNSKYLKYAIGEIVLVVIGILIALAINNWNEARKDRIKEQLILKALLTEVESNFVTLDSTIKVNLKNKASAEEIASYTGTKNEALDEKKFAKLFGKAFKNEMSYNPALGIQKEIISTGNLSVIKNQNLRSTISSWDAKLQRIYYQQEQVEIIRQKIYDLLMSKGNFRRLLDVTKEDEPWYTLEEGSSKRSNLELLTDPEFENNLVLFIGTSAYLDFAFYQVHKTLLKEYKALLNYEIK